MGAFKIILCVVIGGIIANSITYFGYRYFEGDISKINRMTESPTSNGKVYNGLKSPKINITIRNETDNQLNCNKYVGNTVKAFLLLEGREERNYENIEEGEFIGCSIATSASTYTILDWFNITQPGIYALALEQVECEQCGGKRLAWTTVVTKPNGEKIYARPSNVNQGQ